MPASRPPFVRRARSRAAQAADLRLDHRQRRLARSRHDEVRADVVVEGVEEVGGQGGQGGGDLGAVVGKFDDAAEGLGGEGHPEGYRRVPCPLADDVDILAQRRQGRGAEGRVALAGVEVQE